MSSPSSKNQPGMKIKQRIRLNVDISHDDPEMPQKEIIEIFRNIVDHSTIMESLMDALFDAMAASEVDIHISTEE
jgi:hypothetical protein